jgi:hypothetical protein
MMFIIFRIAGVGVAIGVGTGVFVGKMSSNDPPPCAPDSMNKVIKTIRTNSFIIYPLHAAYDNWSIHKDRPLKTSGLQ